jgi:hypothetical protein
MTRPRSGTTLLFTGAVAILIASFAFNGLRVVDPSERASFQVGSDTLVATAIVADREGSPAATSGFLVSPPDTGGIPRLYRPVPGLEPDNRGRSTYVSQFGLQGAVLSALAPRPVDSVAGFLSQARLASAILLAVVLALGLLIVIRHFGLTAAGVTLVLLATSPWLILFSRSLYWQAWMFFVPPLVVFLVYDRTRRVGPAAIAAFVTVLVRELVSYEYATNVVAFTAVVVVAADAARGLPARRILWNAFRVGGAGAAAVVVAIAAHIAKLAALAGSSGAAVLAIRERIAVRSYGTSVEGFAYFTTGPFRDFMKSHFPWCSEQCQNTAFLGRYLLLPAFTVPFVRIGVPIGMVVLLAFIVLAVWRRRGRIEDAAARRAWSWTLCVALAATLTWTILMPHHMLNHLHINAMTWYLPMLPVAYVFLADQLAQRLRRSGAR